MQGGLQSSSSLILLCARIKANPATPGVAAFIRIDREPQFLLLDETGEGTPQAYAPLILRDTGNLLQGSLALFRTSSTLTTAGEGSARRGYP